MPTHNTGQREEGGEYTRAGVQRGVQGVQTGEHLGQHICRAHATQRQYEVPCGKPCLPERCIATLHANDLTRHCARPRWLHCEPTTSYRSKKRGWGWGLRGAERRPPGSQQKAGQTAQTAFRSSRGPCWSPLGATCRKGEADGGSRARMGPSRPHPCHTHTHTHTHTLVQEPTRKPLTASAVENDVSTRNTSSGQ